MVKIKPGDCMPRISTLFVKPFALCTWVNIPIVYNPSIHIASHKYTRVDMLLCPYRHQNCSRRKFCQLLSIFLIYCKLMLTIIGKSTIPTALLPLPATPWINGYIYTKYVIWSLIHSPSLKLAKMNCYYSWDVDELHLTKMRLYWLCELITFIYLLVINVKRPHHIHIQHMCEMWTKVMIF